MYSFCRYLHGMRLIHEQLSSRLTDQMPNYSSILLIFRCGCCRGARDSPYLPMSTRAYKWAGSEPNIANAVAHEELGERVVLNANSNRF